MVGRILHIEALLLFLPFAVSLIYKEKCSIAFLITILIAIAVGVLLTKLFGKNDKMIFAKEGFAIVALAWIAMSMIGALPFYISKEIPSYVDAFFETVSGFTTTGSSIITDLSVMSHGMLFWRSFTHWIGGIIRDRKTIIPGGNDMILNGDKVVVIASNHRLQDLSDILE